MSIYENIKEALYTATSYSLYDIDPNESMTRNDYKFIVPYNLLEIILHEFTQHYDVLDIENNRLFEYNNVYFDTADFTFYYDQYRGRPTRTKVRLREYKDTNTRFLEVKKKIKRGKTSKIRIAAEENYRDVLNAHSTFLMEQGINQHTLSPSLTVSYFRTCFSSSDRKERITIDSGLAFDNMQGGKQSVNQFLVVEIKQNGRRHDSFAYTLLKKMHLREQSFSKYCIGLASSKTADIKHNAFLPVLKSTHLLHSN